MSCFFFFQAEDGIRDIGVTGVQTCALPICPLRLTSGHVKGQDCVWRISRCKSPCVAAGAVYGGRWGLRVLSRVRRPKKTACTPDRERVVVGKSGDFGGRRIIKKKKQQLRR